MKDVAYFNTAEVMRLMNITRSDLYTILRPVRRKGKEPLPPIFTPETESKLTGNYIFTQRDIMKMTRYFRALKEYQQARADLRRTGRSPETSWLNDMKNDNAWLKDQKKE